MEHPTDIPGFYAPVHRALSEPILLAGAPRTIAIANGTIAAALGLGLRLWIAGLIIWIVGHAIAAYAARKDPKFPEVLSRHARHKGVLRC
jgi:type IV secretory pathway TrbD component